MNSVNSPEVFFKLGEGNQIEIYDDGENDQEDDDDGDDDEEGEEGEEGGNRPYGNLNINFEEIEKEKFKDAEDDAK